jgi:hypothetical protein
MTLKQELQELSGLKSVDENLFMEKYALIKAKYTSLEDIRLIDRYIETMISESAMKIDAFIQESTVKIQLENISKIVSLSHIAQNYFHKSRHWLYQKINGCNVNGKPAKFTSDEIETLNLALQDISKKIGSTVIYT